MRAFFVFLIFLPSLLFAEEFGEGKANYGVCSFELEDLTFYTSEVGQTDDTPYLAAWSNDLRKIYRIDKHLVAVSRDFIESYGLGNMSVIYIQLPGEMGGMFVRVVDKLSKYKTVLMDGKKVKVDREKQIDLYLGNNKKRGWKIMSEIDEKAVRVHFGQCLDYLSL